MENKKENNNDVDIIFTIVNFILDTVHAVNLCASCNKFNFKFVLLQL